METIVIEIIIGVILLAFLIVCIIQINTKKKEIELLKSKRDNLDCAIEGQLKRLDNYQELCDKYEQDADKARRETDLLEEYNQKLRDQADKSAQAYYDQIMKATRDKIEIAIQDEGERYQKAQKEFQDDYQQVMLDMTTAADKYAKTAKRLVDEIDDLKSKQRAAIEASKRAAEEKDKQNFYRIQIPDSDLLEISKLREILPYLRDQDTLNKVIYKIYYENPVNDLIGRVIGKKQGGIYKITNIHNGKCYVGQAVNFANRWKQHIKRGVGAEPMTHNKLYPAMLGDGVENFTFEVIEECPSNKLNEREQYWQNYFGAKEYGYSIK